ncbi:hypothetical protein QQ008_11220 [Fulvivirgaceae bacterium BMA10]|uniref:Uncharacterized protein n=1 Tax=Splendidivirga corallicola TaxID=3051826 RepID=A0ABT8KMJ6_9BACT|nr:hypothetical protein [Fulvivirgaceae bacterium BMA10]
MKTVLNWKKKILGRTYKILSGEKTIGKLKANWLCQSAIGEMDGRKIGFRIKGYLQQKTDIIDLETNKLIGKITFDCWKPKARIDYENSSMYWRFNNLWETKCSVFNMEGIKVDYQSRTMEGHGAIKVNTQDHLWVLFGLYIINYYRHLALVIGLSLLPFYISWLFIK